MKKLFIEINILKYNKDSWLETALNWLKVNLIRGAILFTSPVWGWIGKKKIPKFIKTEKNYFEVDIKGNKINIPHKSIKILKEGDSVNLKFEVNNLDVDKLIEVAVGNNLEGNVMINNLVREINSKTSEEDKFELIQFLLYWANKNDIINIAMKSMIESDAPFADKLKVLNLQFGNIEVTK